MAYGLAAKKLRDICRKTPIILLPTGQINAMAAAVPDHPNEAVVLLEFRLTLALEYITELAFWSALADDIEDSDKLRAVAQSFCDLYSLPVLNNGILRYPSFVRGIGPDQAKIITLSSCIAFIVGHEYTHVTEGHLRLAKKQTIRLSARDVEIFNYAQRLEIEADTIAFEHLIKAAPPKPHPFLSAPLLVVTFFSALDHIHYALTNQSPAESTHPSGFSRFDHLMSTFSKQIAGTSRTFAIRFHQVVLRSLTHLHECDLTELAKCHELHRESASRG